MHKDRQAEAEVGKEVTGEQPAKTKTLNWKPRGSEGGDGGHRPDSKARKHNRHEDKCGSAKQLCTAAARALQSSRLQVQTPRKTCSQQTGQNERVENTTEGENRGMLLQNRHSIRLKRLIEKPSNTLCLSLRGVISSGLTVSGMSVLPENLSPSIAGSFPPHPHVVSGSLTSLSLSLSPSLVFFWTSLSLVSLPPSLPLFLFLLF